MSNRLPFILWLVCLAAPLAAAPAGSIRAAIHANNVGLAHMNRNEYPAARADFLQALRLAPGWTEARVNLGIAWFAAGKDVQAASILRGVLRAHPHDARSLYVLGLMDMNHGRFAAAAARFRGVLALEPRDPDANYFYAFSLFHQGKYRPAAEYYRRTLRENPRNLSALFGLATVYRQLNQPRLTEIYMRRFLQLRRASPLNQTVGVVYGKQGRLARVSGRVPAAERARPHPVPVHYVNAAAQAGIVFRNRARHPAQFAGSGACVVDEGHPGRPDLFFVNDRGAPAYFRNLGNGHFANVSARLGFNRTMRGLGCAVADYDNSGHPSIAVSEPHRVLLFRLNRAGHYVDVAAKVGIHAPGPNLGLAFIDLMHNGWADLLVSGVGRVRVFRNLATGHFQAWTGTDIGETPGDYAGLLGTDYNNDRAVDVVLTRLNAPPGIFANLRTGRFDPRQPWNRRHPPVASARGVIALDYNQNRRMDLFFTRPDGPPVLLRNTRAHRFRPVPLPASNARIQSEWGATALDFDNDGFVDLAFIGKRDGRERLFLYRNLGNGGFADVSRAAGLDAISLHHARTLLAADLFGDGAPALVITQAGGKALVLRNLGAAKNHSILIAAKGLKDNHLGLGDKITIYAGALRQKTEVEGGSGYLGQNPAAQLFGLGAEPATDFVRILWPTGVDQDEFPKSAVASITELNRAGGSCPMLYAWTGAHFRFLGDLIGPGVIGEWAGAGKFDTPAPSEYFKIAAGLRPRHGFYDFRFTDQMEEVVYLDKVRLLAVDHPAAVHVFGNDRYQPQGRPAPFRWWQAARLRAPLAARDGHGRNLLPYLHGGRQYTPIYARSRYPGYVGTHSLILDFGDLRHIRHAQLLLHGWTDYYFPDQEWTARQAGIRDLPPALAVALGHGRWRTLIPSMGAPAGLPRTIVVNLDPYLRWLRRRRLRLRIRTNLAIYWNRIQLSLNAPRLPLRITRLRAASARLRHLGYPLELAANSVNGRVGQQFLSLAILKKLPKAMPAGRFRAGFLLGPALINDIKLSASMSIRNASGFGRTFAKASAPKSKSGRAAPPRYDYSRILQNIGYRQVGGNYTRYGDIRPLLARRDDEYAIMASGDEIALRFAAAALPPLPPGWKRTFFFYADGYTKGDDFLDAFPNRVGPLPLRRVAYPTPPHTPIPYRVLEYRLRYNTRHIPSRPQTLPLARLRLPK